MRLARPHVGWSALQRPAAFLPQARGAALGPAWAAPPPPGLCLDTAHCPSRQTSPGPSPIAHAAGLRPLH